MCFGNNDESVKSEEITKGVKIKGISNRNVDNLPDLSIRCYASGNFNSFCF